MIWMWAVMVVSVVATILNIKQRREGFLLWMFTNASWSWYDFAVYDYAQSSLFFVYFCLAVWGFFAWKTPKVDCLGSTPDKR